MMIMNIIPSYHYLGSDGVLSSVTMAPFATREHHLSCDASHVVNTSSKKAAADSEVLSEESCFTEVTAGQTNTELILLGRVDLNAA